MMGAWAMNTVSCSYMAETRQVEGVVRLKMSNNSSISLLFASFAEYSLK